MFRRVSLGCCLAFWLASGAAADEGITIALGGDVMLGRLVDRTIQKDGARAIWGDVLPLLQSADLAHVNLECVIAATGERFHPPRVFYFRAAPSSIEALTVAGIDSVSLANNHAMDFRAPALVQTIRHLDDRGIAHTGAGRDLATAAEPAIVERRGIKVGIVAFADHFREYAATTQSPGTNVIEIRAPSADFGRVREAIRAARRRGADLVVFSIHWGPNMRVAPPGHFVEFAHAVMDAGADIYHGHSAHLFQAIEIYDGKPIFYDTGELIDDYAVDPELRNDRQLLFVVHATKTGIEAIELVPLRIELVQVNRARADDVQAIARRIRELSSPFGTRILRSNGRLVVDLAGREGEENR